MINVITFKMTGISEILMNNPASMNEQGSTSVRTKKVLPKEDAEKRLYLTEDGNFYIPSIAFLRGLWQGAAYQKIGKDSARSLIQASVFLTEEQTVLLNKDTEKPISEYEIDSRTVVIKSTGGRIMRHRPKVKNWMCLLSLEIDSDFIPADMLITLFNRAGRMIGVMDYRPEKRGSFGRYTVELYQNNKKKRTK